MGWLEGQTALVTGGASGLGRAVVDRFVQEGARVVVLDRSAEHIEKLRADHDRRTVVTVKGDVTSPSANERAVAAAVKAFGQLDIFIGNAGIQRDAAFTEMSLDDWRQVIDVDLTGQFLCAQEAVRCFKRQGFDEKRSLALGKIVFINSVHQRIPWSGHVNYAAAKGGLALLMQSMAQELAPEKIRVNAIAPGAIRTPINRPAWDSGEARTKLLELIPYGRIGAPEDVAQAAVWLASDRSDYVVGATLFIDGGMALYPAFREGG